MTVVELRAALEALPAEADGWSVVLSRDAEGNAFSPLRDTQSGAYASWSTGDGDFAAAEECDPGVSLNALCLWPVR